MSSLQFLKWFWGRCNQSAGVSNTDAVTGMVQILKDLGLENRLRVDIFDPFLYRYTRSTEDRYIVKVQPQTLSKAGKEFAKYKEWKVLRNFYDTLGQLVRAGEIGVYTANA